MSRRISSVVPFVLLGLMFVSLQLYAFCPSTSVSRVLSERAEQEAVAGFWRELCTGVGTCTKCTRYASCPLNTTGTGCTGGSGTSGCTSSSAQKICATASFYNTCDVNGGSNVCGLSAVPAPCVFTAGSPGSCAKPTIACNSGGSTNCDDCS